MAQLQQGQHEGLDDALQALLKASPPFDAVVVEASGVSDPWRIAQVGLADPALSRLHMDVIAGSAADLVRLRILVNAMEVDALSMVCHRDAAAYRGRKVLKSKADA
mgnify:CR=1 FL=1